MSLSQRYPDIDFPEGSSEEEAHVRKTFAQISNMAQVSPFQQLLALSKGMQKEVPPPVPLKKAAVFSPPIGFVKTCRCILFALSCSSNAQYQSGPNVATDSAELIAEKEHMVLDRVAFKQFEQWIKRHQLALNAKMTSAFEAKNETLRSFYALLLTHQELQIAQLKTPETNVWCRAEKGTHAVTLFSKTLEQGSRIVVSKNQAHLLAACHQVNHYSGYIVAALTPVLPPGKEHAIGRLWDEIILVHGNEDDISTWDWNVCSVVEKHLMEIYHSINSSKVSSE
jgi:hypothetical protein